jgi:O-antigen ligase
MYCVALAGLIVCAELLAAYVTTVQFVDGEIVKGSVVLGWGVWTTIGGMLAFLMPAHFYFAASHKHGWIGLVLGFFQYFCILLSQSRGALLVGSVILLICLVYLFFKGENRTLNRIIMIGTVVVGALGVVLMADKLLGLIQNFLNMGFDDNGRFWRWEKGLTHFLEHPVFGSGFYDSYVDEGWDMDVFPYLYHNTPVQLLGSLGIVGTLSYAYHRFLTLRLVFKKQSVGKTFLGICILGLLLFSLTDVLFFKTYPTIIYSLMLLFMDRSNSFDENQKIIL